MDLDELKNCLVRLEVDWSLHDRPDSLWLAGEGERHRFRFGARLDGDVLTLACQLSDGEFELTDRAVLQHVLLLNDDLTVFRLYSDAKGEIWLCGEWPQELLNLECVEWLVFDFVGFCDDLCEQFRTS